MIKKLIRHRLKNYKLNLNNVNVSLPEKVKIKKKIAVIGGGIAGMSAAAELGEKGFEVQLFEKSAYLGGKYGSWTFTGLDGKEYRTEHAFHGIFRNYYNFRNFLDKIGSTHFLEDMKDYLIILKDRQKFSFGQLEKTPLLNVIHMFFMGLFDYWEVFKNPKTKKMLELLRYHPQRTFKKYDDMSFQTFCDEAGLPAKIRLIFSTFTRSFFAEPEDMSMAELIKGFHFYFLSNDRGLVYDFFSDDCEHSLLEPYRKFIAPFSVHTHLNKPVEMIDEKEDLFYIQGESFDYAMICSNAMASKKIVESSPAFSGKVDMSGVKPTSSYYAVLKLWMDKKVGDEYTTFTFFDRVQIMDSVTFYHRITREAKAWSKENEGGIYELHAYSVPNTFSTDSKVIRQALIDDFLYYFPALKDAKILNEYFQYKNDFAAFDTGCYAKRPTVQTKHPRLFFAGDWVKLDHPSMLTEAAYTSGVQAANFICEREGVRETQLYAVPSHGVLP